MLTKDLKEGDYLWGIPIKNEDLENPEINCYYIKKVKNFTDSILEIEKYEPLLDPDDKGLIIIPTEFDINNIFFLHYGGTCIWAYSADSNKIVNLYSHFISKKPNKIKFKCFSLFNEKWVEVEI